MKEDRNPEEPARMLDQQDNHGQNNQEFLAFLNLATAQIRTLLEKTTKKDAHINQKASG